MSKRTEKEFWIEMSIREIWTQCHFAELAYHNVNRKGKLSTDAVFSSIYSFLSHCAMVSKMLAADDGETPSQTIGDVLDISSSSIIHNRVFRNHLEHYDERLKIWIREKGVNVSIGTYNIGPKAMIQGANFVLVSHYDPNSRTFTFVDEDFELGTLYQEVKRIKKIADEWVKANT